MIQKEKPEDRILCPHSKGKERFKLVIILLQNDFRLCFSNRTSAISEKGLISSPEIVSKKSCILTFCKNCCIEMIFKEIPTKGKLQYSVLQVIKTCIHSLNPGFGIRFSKSMTFYLKPIFTYQVRLCKLVILPDS